MVKFGRPKMFWKAREPLCPMGALLGLHRGVLMEICPRFVFGARLGLGTYPGSYLPLTAPGYRRIGAGNGRIGTSGHVSESPRAVLSDGVTFGTFSGHLDGDMSAPSEQSCNFTVFSK